MNSEEKITKINIKRREHYGWEGEADMKGRGVEG